MNTNIVMHLDHTLFKKISVFALPVSQNNGYVVGFAVCSKKDAFSRKKGRMIAYGRALVRVGGPDNGLRKSLQRHSFIAKLDSDDKRGQLEVAVRNFMVEKGFEDPLQ